MEEDINTTEEAAALEPKKKVAKKAAKKAESKKAKAEDIIIDMLESVILAIGEEIKSNKHPRLVTAISHARSCRDRIKEARA